MKKSFGTNNVIIENLKCWKVETLKSWNIENLKSWTFVFTISTEIVRIKIWKLKVEKSFGTNNVIVENLKCWKVETLKRWKVEKFKLNFYNFDRKSETLKNRFVKVQKFKNKIVKLKKNVKFKNLIIENCKSWKVVKLKIKIEIENWNWELKLYFE